MAGSLVGIVRDARPDLDVSDALEGPLDAFVATAVQAWPAIAVDRAAFVRFVARALEAPAETTLASLHADDLYLAYGCVAGDPAALAGFESACLGVIDRAVVASGATPTEVADLRQVVRQRLLVAPAPLEGEGEREPRIATFTGRGNLRSWVRVVATREAQRLLPRERREVAADDDELAGLIARDDDPEIGYLKRLYRAEFKDAFATAVSQLSDRERVLLRQNALDGLSIDQLAAFYRVHRATTARWIEAARQAVLDGTRKELIRRLQLSRSELDSVMRLISSQLDVSLPRVLVRG
jgi:RNA polymerase sigma-70 factor (ECF subfamily)